MKHFSYNSALVAIAFCMTSVPVSAQQAPAITNMYRGADPGWVERGVYRSESDAKVSVEISDVLIGPGRAVVLKAMTTGALLEVKAGIAKISIDQKPQRISPGMVLSVDEGQALSIDNTRGRRPFVARLIRISLPR